MKKQTLREAAKGRPCMIRIPGVCSVDPSKTVLCHLRDYILAGISQKPSDLVAVLGCSECHALIDLRSPPPHYLGWGSHAPLKIQAFKHQALVMTLQYWDDNGTFHTNSKGELVWESN